ncbi:hypothetical protein XA68_15680 [Ophiocordyceps unilateralis]|uniref:ABC transporter domain-containing protein n=1 Tax=Ophiocordyceps unilateralis TaxID=268505 RepID=A0A2A9P7W4_OPHUN|nr:hypothetical protein XA68_15680 [Ophiocordyceps unilateralis]
MAPSPGPPQILTNNLTYTFATHATGIRNITLDLPPRSRTLLIGANGSGKTTLLRLLAGQRLAPAGSVSVCGLDPFALPLEGVTYLGLEWVLNPVVRGNDIPVTHLLRSVGGDAFPRRRDDLVALLDVDVRWRMHAISDGERRRVQLAMGLLRPWSVLFLDEITVDLDVLARARFLAWLRDETDSRDCSIVYATHILDNLAEWPTHLVHMHLGAVKEWGPAEEMLRSVDEKTISPSGNSRLGDLALRWLEADLADRGPRDRTNLGSEGKTYGFGDTNIGGYGYESRKSEA